MALGIDMSSGAPDPATPVELFRDTFYADAYVPDAAGQRILIARPTASFAIVPLEIITNPLR